MYRTGGRIFLKIGREKIRIEQMERHTFLGFEVTVS